MNIIRVEYRFLRLSANILALVELHPNSDIPQATTCLYPEHPYLTNSRKLETVNIFEDLDEWIVDQNLALELAIEEAKRKSILEFNCNHPEYREVCLWVYRDPLVYWDEYCPLFDNNYNYVLRD